MIRLDQLSFAWDIWKILPSPEQALTGLPLTRSRLRRPNSSGQKCENTGVPKLHIRIDSALSSRRGIGNACVCRGVRGVALDMSRIHLECPDSDSSDRSVAADVLLRQEPDEEEEEDEGDDKENDDDDDEDDGYSE